MTTTVVSVTDFGLTFDKILFNYCEIYVVSDKLDIVHTGIGGVLFFFFYSQNYLSNNLL